MRRLLVLAAGVLTIGTATARATTIDVTVADDLLAADGRCSLREAVRSANLDAAQFPGAGECAAGNLADTINLPAGPFKLSIAGPPDEDASSGDLDVLAPLTIVGAGAGATTIDADHIDRVLDVKTGVAVNLQGLTITGGHAPNTADMGPSHGDDGSGGDATGAQPFPGENGGGIRSAGALTITDSAIVNNEAGSGGSGGAATGGYGATPVSPGQGGRGGNATGGRGGAGGKGGGIYSAGSLTLMRVRVQGNKAGAGGKGGNATGGQGGGGNSDWGGAGGTASAGGGGGGGTSGGIHQIGGATLTIQDSTISVNAAGAGGNGGTALGGFGGPGFTFAGSGGVGYGGTGGDGGDAGGIIVGASANISRALLSGNHAGDGGSGGNGTGNGGSPLIGGSGGSAGDGGEGRGGNGGAGGSGGALWTAAVTATNDTLSANASAAGGNAGAGTGGHGGNGSIYGPAGDGGNATGGDGGRAGNGGAILTIGSIAVQHATIIGNALGASKAGGSGAGGAPGSNGTSAGATGTGTNGASAVSAQGGAISRGLDPVTISGSIVAGNTSPACASGSFGGANDISFGDPSCPGANADPLLGPLGDNGGPTFTQRPGNGSPAIDAAPADGCPATDQRGATRPHGAGCDIGAYEIAPPDVAVTAAAATVQGTVNPNARETTYHFEYGTSGAYGSTTPNTTLGAGTTLVAVSAALNGLTVGATYHLRLVATNADGTAASPDSMFTATSQGGGGADTTAPVILSASVKPKKFKRKRGTTFRYRLSEAARVTFTVQRRKGKRFVRAKRFSKASKAGANKKKFTTRKLKPGRYRATLVATDAAGNRSKARRLTFRIVR